MAQFHNIIVAEDAGILTVTLHRPAARNALDAATMAELTAVARAHRTKPSLRAIILTGGPEYFCAGADLSPAGADRGAVKPSLLEQREAMLAGPDLCRAWEEIEPVTIAVIEGFCIGGGCALAAACDFRVLGAGAFVRLPEVPLGMNMSWRTLPRLVSLIGPARTKRLVILGEAVDAPTCLTWGLADEVVPQGQALAHAQALAAKIAALPPLPVRMSKEAISMAAGALHQGVSYMDRDQFLLTIASKDFEEGVKALFEKREPRFFGD